jgi:signal transduction histidine kinase
MTQSVQTETDDHAIKLEQDALKRSGSLHWFHWLVVALSLLLTLVVWQYSRLQLQEKIESRFNREADQVITLITERLQKYEDALWAGVATLSSHDGEMNNAQWKAFATDLRLPQKYKGINGIGVIHNIELSAMDTYLHEQRQLRPEYAIHPLHNKPYRLPITYIEPVQDNIVAVGLDVAHETNRLTAALKARDTGVAQITGPITLVQDAERTPGFLFYTPFYRAPLPHSLSDRRQRFAGMIYAPFVVHKLMRGTLDKSRRQIGISIFDGENALYDENLSKEADFDLNSRFENTYVMDIYGREWQIKVRANNSFREDTSSSQTTMILLGGISIDVMLLSLFILLTRANRRAVGFAKRMSESYQGKAQQLEQTVNHLIASNKELEQFAFAASHDLQEPLRTLSNFSDLIKEELAENEANEKVLMSARFIGEAAERMRNQVFELMSYSRIGRSTTLTTVDCTRIINDTLADLDSAIKASKADVKVGKMPRIEAYESELRLLFQNLISNAIKFHQKNSSPQVNISCMEKDDHWCFTVSDNGIGIEADYLEQIFTIFKRLHTQDSYPGSGIGLANCKKVVNMHGGRIWADSRPDNGSVFHFTIPKIISS